MKRHQITSLIALSMVAGTTLLVDQTPAQANAQRFRCVQSGGVPATMAKTKRGFVPVIKWSSEYFGASGWSPKARCQEVSARFESYHRNGTLNFLTTGRMNRQPVVCVARSQGGPCSGLLFTLKPGSNPGQTLQKLLDVRYRATGPLNESTARVYIDMNELLSKTPIDQEIKEDSALAQPRIDSATQSQVYPTISQILGIW